jgi:hypothetical protein
MSLKEELDNASVGQLIRWWNGDEIPESAKTTFLFLEKTGGALSRAGLEGVEFLRTQVESDDVYKRALALKHLANPLIADERTTGHLVNAFRCDGFHEPETVVGFKILALDGLVRIEQYPFERDEIALLLEHEDTELAATAMIYLSHAYTEETIEILRAGLKSKNPRMRASACAEVGFRNIYQLKKEVAALLSDADVYVARAAQTGCFVLEVCFKA